MITLTVILLQVIPDFNFFHILIAAMVIDLVFFLFLFIKFERQKKSLNEKYTKIINGYKAEQAKLEEMIEQYGNAQPKEENKKGILSYNLKEQQELRDKLEKSLEKQKEQKNEINTYKDKLEAAMEKLQNQVKVIDAYKAKLAKYENSGTAARTGEKKEKTEDALMAKLQPVPSDVKM